MTDNRFLRRLSAGEWVFREGDPGDCAFVIESGRVAITYEHDGVAETIAQLGPGELLGEMALIDGRARSASARAATDLRLRTVTFEHLNERLGAADPMLRVLLKVMLSRYRDFLARGSQRPTETDDLDRTAMLDRLEMEQDLMLALERREFQLVYQPIIKLDDLSTGGFEALLRWVSPIRGYVSPADFVPAAEASGLIVPIGRWILHEACAALARMAPRGDVFMNINLSGRQLVGAGPGDDVAAALRASGLSARRVKLEVTESLLMEDFENAIEVLAALRGSGFQIAIDDFGTGYSSLSYLHRLPVDTLKIDRSFIGRIVDDEPSSKIVAALGGLAQRLGMNVVAEGVETAAQVRALREMGFEYAQGYYFSRMVPEAEAQALVSRAWVVDPG
jgi:EAL domain-containing protein (putative c-di-GMP-specific phosphodiesterase class I)